MISCVFTDSEMAYAAQSGTVASKNGSEGNELIVHFKSPWNGANIFYWNVNGKYNNPVKWPGDAMSPTGDGWYSYIIEDASSASIMFTYDGKMTTDFVQNAGEFWYMNNQWYDKNPSAGDVTPLPTATPTPKPIATTVPTKEPSLDITNTPIPTNVPFEDGIKINFNSTEDNVKITYWNVKGENPSTDKVTVDMVKVGNEWHTYILEGATSVSFMFNVNGTNTSKLFVAEGEWWYENGELSDYGPVVEMTTTPEATVTPEPTIGADVTVAPTGGADITEIPIPTGAAGVTITPEPVITPGDDITVTPEPTAEPIVTLEATATPGPTATPTPTKVPVTGKMVLHVKTGWSNVNIYYWAVNGNESDKPVEWPGTPMTSEGNSWYTYTIEDATSAKVIFNNGSAQTDDLSQIEGEWWYQDGKWTSNDPTVPTASPTPT